MAKTTNQLPTLFLPSSVQWQKAPYRVWETSLVFHRARHSHMIPFPLELEQKRHVHLNLHHFPKRKHRPSTFSLPFPVASLQMWCWWAGAERADTDHPLGVDDAVEGSHPPTVDPPLTYGLSCEKVCFAGATAYFGAFCYSSLAWSLTNPSGLTWSGYDNGLFCAHVTEKFSGNPAVPIYTEVAE